MTRARFSISILSFFKLTLCAVQFRLCSCFSLIVRILNFSVLDPFDTVVNSRFIEDHFDLTLGCDLAIRQSHIDIEGSTGDIRR